MDNLVEKVLKAVKLSEVAFTKFITANDTGATGGHQAGFHIHKNAWKLFFDQEGTKGENKEKFVTIKWQDSFETDSRFIYYGVGTRNEYRLTRFGRKFPFLSDDNVGDLLVLSKLSDSYYEAFVLQKDEDIEDFFSNLNISSTETNRLIFKKHADPDEILSNCFHEFINKLNVDFPSTFEIAKTARTCYNVSNRINDKQIRNNPDKEILGWLATEFKLFKTIENNRYATRIKSPFSSVEEMVDLANTILNRRKSRAGKSLEHHLEEIFKLFELGFEKQAIIEGNKKPDFLFPNVEAYLDSDLDNRKLVFLAAKTTCKDRWRQILNEADKIKIKHLFTLQQGISKNQLNEMYKYNVCLVVPKQYISSFPKEYTSRILTLEKFIAHVKQTQ